MDDSDLGSISQQLDPQVERAVSPDDDWTVEKIIAELEREYDGTLPEDAILAAQERRDAMIPHLIKLVERATAFARDGEFPAGNGPLIAVFLLAEFRAKEALPAIIDAMSLSFAKVDELYGDAITEDFCRVFAMLAADAPEQIDSLITNRSLVRHVRWEAAETYLLWVRDGRLTRAQAVEKLRQYLRGAIANRDRELIGPLVAVLDRYVPREAMEEINEAFRRRLVDESIISRDEIEESLAEGDAHWRDELANCRPTEIEDTVAELQEWWCYRGDVDDEFDEAGFEDDYEGHDDDEDGEDISQSMQSMMASHRRLLDGDSILLDDEFQDALAGDADDDTIDDRRDTPPETIRREGPRVGRNEPCPCGSGKKFKKCCGKK